MLPEHSRLLRVVTIGARRARLIEISIQHHLQRSNGRSANRPNTICESMIIHLARASTDLTVIAITSPSGTVKRVRKMGDHNLIDHHQPLAAQVEALSLKAPTSEFSAIQTDKCRTDIVELTALLGNIALIDVPRSLDSEYVSVCRRSITLNHIAQPNRATSEFSNFDQEMESRVATACPSNAQYIAPHQSRHELDFLRHRTCHSLSRTAGPKLLRATDG